MNIEIMAKRRFNIPVGVVIGLAFSGLLIVICSGIIAYTASMERRNAGPLLEEYGRLMVQRGTRTIEEFFADQERLIILASRTSPDLAEMDSLADVPQTGLTGESEPPQVCRRVICSKLNLLLQQSFGFANSHTLGPNGRPV